MTLPIIIGLAFVLAIVPIGRKAKQKIKAKQEQKRQEKRGSKNR